MTKYVRKLILAMVLIPAFTGVALPQGKPLTPLKIQVILSRYEGEKKISSVPYTLSLSANDRGVSLRMGSQVPMPTGKDGAFSYMNVGTNIDCNASTTDDGRFKIELTVDDSSVDGRSGDPRLAGVLTLKNFRTNNIVVLRDGQSAQFTAATDKVSGEVVKVDVTLNVEK
jgi:hypothetical protein